MANRQVVESSKGWFDLGKSYGYCKASFENSREHVRVFGGEDLHEECQKIKEAFSKVRGLFDKDQLKVEHAREAMTKLQRKVDKLETKLVAAFVSNHACNCRGGCHDC